MTPENLVEIGLDGAERVSRHDSNWISHHSGDPNEEWIHSYWTGDLCPGHQPAWEMLVDGRVTILGTEFRSRAYAAIEDKFPDSLCLLEIARVAAWIGSDLGTIAPFLTFDGTSFTLQYVFNMVQAKDPQFLDRLAEYKASGQPFNWNDCAAHFRNDSFGSVPDFTPYNCRWPADKLTFLSSLI